MLRVFVFLIFISFFSCSNDEIKSKYLRWVGDAEFDAEMDSDTFKICYNENFIKQYFNFGKGMQFKGEKSALIKAFKQAYKPVDKDQSGWIRIRFIVNCRGETGRFRITASDLNYKTQIFEESISAQLMQITKSLQGWTPLPDEENAEDYYQYLVFKIDQGKIETILP